MSSIRAWKAYRPTYRAKEVKALVDWVLASVGGTVVGLAGAGKSNLLGFLCHRPEVLRSYLPPQADPVALIPVDLSNLPSNSLATLYRAILRSFYEIRDCLDSAMQQAIANLYLENRGARDPFLSQSALRELLMQFQAQSIRVVLVLDHFGAFCERATPQMLDTLRGLRDSFKDTLCYVVGTRCEVAYLPDSVALGEMYEILDTHVCWVGPMNESDARQLVAEETHFSPSPPVETEIDRLLALTGGYPGLLKAACHWWLATSERLPTPRWEEALLAECSIRSRLEEIWNGLTQEEQLALAEVQKLQSQTVAGREATSPKYLDHFESRHGHALTRLNAMRLCQRTEVGWCIFAGLFAAFVAEASGRSRGRIWLDEKANTLYQGPTPLDGLEPLERKALRFFLEHPRIRHTKTDLILNIWPREVLVDVGKSDECLYQLIHGLREKIEPDPARPCYIVTWRARRPLEGGYQFFPEGRPG